MTFGMDAQPSDYACCFSRIWEDRNIGIGVMLYGFGTKPHPLSVCPTGITKTLYQVRSMMIEQLEALATSVGAEDVRYASTMITDALTNANMRVREIRQFLGQGIYIGGTVLYVAGNSYAVVSFGGSSAYHYTGLRLEPLTAPAKDMLVRDAIGGLAAWKPNVITAEFQKESIGLLAVSSPAITEQPFLRHLAATGANDFAHSPAILVLHDLDTYPDQPSAVLHFTR